jgi:hypothetical protein
MPFMLRLVVKSRTCRGPTRHLPGCYVAITRVTNDVGAFLRNQANGRAQGTNEGSVSSTHCVSPLLFQTARDTKLLPVVQLRSSVIWLMGDPDLKVRLPVSQQRPAVPRLRRINTEIF